jgi:hypothetical protein
MIFFGDLVDDGLFLLLLDDGLGFDEVLELFVVETHDELDLTLESWVEQVELLKDEPVDELPILVATRLLQAK